MYDSFLQEESEIQRNQREENAFRRASEKDFCSVQLTIRHPNCDPSHISQLLELEPSNTLTIAQTVVKTARYHVKSPDCFWTYEWCDEVGMTHPTLLLQYLLDDFHGKLPAIRQLQNEGARLSIKIQLEQWTSNSCVEFSSTALARIKQLNAKVSMLFLHRTADDSYRYDGDDEEDVDDEELDELQALHRTSGE